ncbi:class I SAM-dependent methyltransferase [Nonomuraea sp. NPDC059194]|uniref:class I SAM-dependent methyltransferase n=1 Tax=Nonomuraea sp. NPDC059194 TaxID=3346764 RepID=UPI0036B121F3
MSRWSDLTGGNLGKTYDGRFAALAASGADVHGEARFCAALVPPGSRVLDAGCGTGRVAIWLAEQGYDVVGVDLDSSMLAVAKDRAPHLTWIESDLAALDLEPIFDLVVAAGNVIPLLAEGTEPQTIRNLANTLAPDGVLVAGFGLDAMHLPVRPTFTLDEYDAWCEAAGLRLDERFATWDGVPYENGGYAVSVHRR